MDRQLIQYLPRVVREVRELKAITDGQQAVLSDLWDAEKHALDDQFVDTATENGIQRWERILGLTPKATDILEDRRFQIKTRLNEQLPYTLAALRMQLASLCGEDGYTVEIARGSYVLIVKVALTAKNNLEAVRLLLNRVVPANVVIQLDLKYNQHVTLGAFTHGKLSEYTHTGLRTEVIS